MSEYLTKEEIRKWRSSLERITLEEYAARLGKVIQEEKHDDSFVDSITLKSLNSMTDEEYMPKTEKLQPLAVKSFAKEKEIQHKQMQEKQKEQAPLKKSENSSKINMPKETAPAEKAAPAETKKKPQKAKESKPQKDAQPVLNFSFSKALTAREQLVFDHFAANVNTIVYAKDLAKILELPRDYVYKYIKNLRSKIRGDVLQNSENGGYILKVKN